MQSLETKISRPRPKSETETRPETFETETPKSGSRDMSRDRDQASRLHHWYSLCLQVLRSRRQKTHLHCLNSYNWSFEDKHNADMVLSEIEFDNLLQCSRMSEGW